MDFKSTAFAISPSRRIKADSTGASYGWLRADAALPSIIQRRTLEEVSSMPQGQPQKREKKKPKKDASSKGVRSTLMDQPSAGAVEVIGKRRKKGEDGA